jgi:hypothetical protein
VGQAELHALQEFVTLQHRPERLELRPVHGGGRGQQRIEVRRRGGGPLQADGAVLLLDRVGRVHAVRQKRLVQQQREAAPVRERAQQKVEVVRVAQGGEQPDPVQQAAAERQVRGGHDEVAVDQRRARSPDSR